MEDGVFSKYGGALLLLTLAGCGGSGTTNAVSGTTSAVPALAAGGASSVYVVQNVSGSTSMILQFSATTATAGAPVSTLATGLYVSVVATDTSGQIYVGGFLTNGGNGLPQVQVYAAGSSGMATPVRTILGSTGSFATLVDMDVDPSGNLCILTGGAVPGIAVFANTANGAATPARLIQGALPQIGSNSITVDKSGNIWVPGGGGVEMFGPTATGNVAASRTITSAGPINFTTITGIDTDASGNVYVLSNSLPVTTQNIYEFAALASGAATPLRTISGTVNKVAVRVDAAGNVYSMGVSGSSPFFSGFAPSLNGTDTASVTSTPNSWTAGPNLTYRLALK